MQLRVTVTQGDLQGYIIQSQGQSVIKKKKKKPGLYYSYSDAGTEWIWSPSIYGREQRVSITVSPADESPLAQQLSASKGKN